MVGGLYCEQIYKIEKEIREAYENDDDCYQDRYETRFKKLE
ncbi:hypothetical protein [Clostridium cellulovorans]|nr:hypothetical protein [Clostridium cellulovorans]